MSRRADQHIVSIARIDQNLRDMLAVFQSDIGPVLAAIGRLVNSIADRDAVAHPGFAAAHPNRLRIRRINRHRADRLHALAVENRFVSRAAIHRLPHAAAGRSHKHGDAPVLLHRVHRGHAAAHRGRADIARRKPRHRRRIKLDRILPRSPAPNKPAEQSRSSALLMDSSANCGQQRVHS